ncbi:hypothetical protein [Lentilactobacillus kribbianus]|uniref:hypothetical protein n=1 Tax=Lentilactobacillus kribbianus TaxID=2729622 RepID=UPI001556130A|nr:hypothetical protein [Lentilactobacillus kribbianus]
MDRLNQIESEIRSMEGGRFQKLCDRYLHQKYGWELYTPGSMDGSNKTTPGTPDTYVYLDNSDKYILTMFGTRKDAVKKLESDIRDAKTKSKLEHGKIDKIVCCYEGSNISVQKHEELINLAKPYSLIILNSTMIAMDLIDEYHTLAIEFFELSNWTGQINSFNKFIEKHDKSETNAPIDTLYVDQDNQVNKLNELIISKQIVIITGKPGAGKTKIAIESLRKLDDIPNNQCLFVKSNGQLLYNDLDGFISKTKNNYVLIDDVNEVKDLASIFSFLQENINLHFIITVRDYALSDIKKISYKYDVDLFYLKELNDETIGQIMKEYFPENKGVRNQIVKLSHNNPRQAVIAAKLVSEKGINVLKNTHSIMVNYYKYVINDAKISDSCMRSLFIVAVFERIKFRDNNNLSSILKVLDLEMNQFVNDVVWLNDKEICNIFQNKAVSIEDQSLRDYILYYYFFESHRFYLKDLFSTIYSYGFHNLVSSLNRASAIEINEINENKLGKIARDFYDSTISSMSEKNKIDYLVMFGIFLESKVIEMEMSIINKLPLTNYVPSFQFKDFDRSARGEYNDFLKLMRTLTRANIKENTSIVVSECLNYLEKNGKYVINITNFFIEVFGFNPELLDPNAILKIAINAFEREMHRNNLVVSECLLFTCRSFLNTRGSKYSVMNDNGNFSYIKYNLDDNSIDMVVRKKILNIISYLVKNNLIPENTFLTLVHEKINYTNKTKKIADVDINTFLDAANASSNISSDNKKFIAVEAKRLDYINNDISVKQVMNSFDSLQECYWIMNNYSNISGEIPYLKKNPQINHLIDKSYMESKKYSYCIAKCMKSNPLVNVDRIEQSFENGLKILNQDQKEFLIKSILETGLEKVNTHILYRLVCMYGIRRFLNDFKTCYWENKQLFYLIYSSIKNPNANDIEILYSLIKNFNKEEWGIVQYDNLAKIVQENSKINELIIDKTINYGQFFSFRFLSDIDAKIFFDNIHEKNKLYDFYIAGLPNEIDINNSLFILLKDDDIFQKKIINFLFNDLNSNYWWSQGMLESKIMILWKAPSFLDLIKLKIEDRNPMYSYFNNGWQAVFAIGTDAKKEWLATILRNTNDINTIKKILNLENRFFSYDDMFYCFKIIADKNYPLKEFSILKFNKYWSGSEVPEIKKDLNFVSKLLTIFKDPSDVVYLKNLQEKLKDKIQDVLMREFIERF